MEIITIVFSVLATSMLSALNVDVEKMTDLVFEDIEALNDAGSSSRKF